jgi:hypothetical protein
MIELLDTFEFPNMADKVALGWRSGQHARPCQALAFPGAGGTGAAQAATTSDTESGWLLFRGDMGTLSAMHCIV